MQLENFAIIKGEGVTIDKGRIKFKVSNRLRHEQEREYKSLNKENDLKSVLLRSDFNFSEGIIEFKVKFTNPQSGVLLVFSNQESKKVVVGHSGQKQLFLIMDDSVNATPTVSANGLKDYKKTLPIHLKVTVYGSQIQLFANHIQLFSTSLNIKETPIEFRLTTQKGEIEIYDIKVSSVKPKLFVVMQFTKDYNELYSEVIKPVVENLNFECVRADEFYTASPILNDIIKSIEESKAIIAEITPDNPNVFYEIGYSHGIRKPTILLCDQKREKLPFDISSFRTLFYENTIAGKKKIEQNLRMFLEQIK